MMKIYGGSSSVTAETRYTPAECSGREKIVKIGEPDKKHISTNYIERQNLIMRMWMRRFTRLTNAFSKKLDNHMASIAIHYMHSLLSKTGSDGRE
jgi:IS1 family transposase